MDQTYPPSLTAFASPVIERVETVLVYLPTLRSHKLSVATMNGQTLMLVRLHCSDGIIGLGEGTTIGGLAYGAESPESMTLVIDSYFAPGVLGQGATRIQSLDGAHRPDGKGKPLCQICGGNRACWTPRASAGAWRSANCWAGAAATACRSPGRWPRAIRPATSPRPSRCWARAGTASSS